MKPEEAIRVIEVAKAECEWNAPLEYQEAFNMAIEALKEQQEHSQNTSSKQPDLGTLGIKTGETCADAISRRDAIDAFMKVTSDGDKAEWCKWVLEQLPSVQPERKTGEWISDGPSYRGGYDWMHCSECGHKEIDCPAGRTNYCPNCGAKMK